MKKLLSLILVFFSVLSINAQVTNMEKYDKRWKTDTTKRTAELSSFKALLPRDFFPVINFPQFLNKQEGLKTYFEKEPVISVSIDNEARAYPLNVLTYHELANDTIAGKPVLISYCPLCNSGIAYDREIFVDDEKHVLKFGVSGMLRKSDMVMWDEKTESWWQQLTGEAVVGELAGTPLWIYSSQIISVEEFFQNYPNGKIMSNQLSEEIPDSTYGTNPYKNYDDISKTTTRFIDWEIDNRLPPLERVVDITDGENYKVYPFKTISEKKVLHDSFNGMDVVLFYKKGSVSILDKSSIKDSRDIGMVTAFSSVVDSKKHTFEYKNGQFSDRETGSVWSITGKCTEGKYKGKYLVKIPHGNHFAFAFLTFYPGTEIYEGK